MNDSDWFFAYPDGVGLAPWEIAWYGAVYLLIAIAAAWSLRRRRK